MTKEKTSVVKKEDDKLVKAPDLSSMFESDAGAGTSDIGLGDMTLPYLSLLESLSPQVKKSNPGYLEGAEPGLIVNTLSKELHSKVKVVPCFYEKKEVEWVPRSKGGGYIGDHELGSAAASLVKMGGKDGKERILPNGNILVETAYFYVLVIPEEGLPFVATIAMSKSRLKSARNWTTLIKNSVLPAKDGGFYTPPIFSQVYSLTSLNVVKGEGDYFIWDVTNLGPITEPEIYLAAKQVNEAASKGLIRRGAPPAPEADEVEAHNAY